MSSPSEAAREAYVRAKDNWQDAEDSEEVFVNDDRLREWRNRVGEDRPVLRAFFGTLNGKNLIVRVSKRALRDADDAPCVICGMPIDVGRKVVGCCAAHGTHLDCHVAAVVCKGWRACVSSMIEPCPYNPLTTSASSDELRIVEHLIREKCKISVNEAFARLREESCVEFHPLADVVSLGTDEPCAVCGCTIASDPQALRTCEIHVTHGHCYAFWRALRACMSPVPQIECPASFFKNQEEEEEEEECVRSLLLFIQ